MEWTKESAGKTYITCRSARAYTKAIEFYESLGYKITTGLTRFYPAKKVFCYVIAYGRIYSSSYETGVISECKEINPFFKPRRKFPREMMVSNDKIKWEKRLVAGIINSSSKYVSYINKEFQEGQAFKFLLAWKYAKEIE